MIGRIPVRNIWLLFLYASNLARFHGQYAAAVEDRRTFPTLIARLLCYAVDRRLRRNLSRGYQQRRAVLSRVRGRIDILETFAGDLLSRGRSPAGLRSSPSTRRVTDLSGRRSMPSPGGSAIGWSLMNAAALPVIWAARRRRAETFNRAALSADRIGRHDAEDLLMVTLARLVFDLVLPTEDAGGHALTRVEKDAILSDTCSRRRSEISMRRSCPVSGGQSIRAGG